MKKILLAILIVTVFFSCSKKNDMEVITQPNQPTFPDTLGVGWKIINVTPGSVINDIFFTSNTNGYLVSNSGIYKSTDGGNTWIQKSPLTGFFNIAASGNNACFVKENAQPLVSNDGASTFQTVTVSQTNDLTDCFYSSTNVCHVSSYLSNHKSIDGGLTFPFHYSFPTSINYSTLFFLNDNNGWTLKTDKLYKTVDGGTTWSTISNVSGNPSAVEFIDLNTGFYSSSSGVSKTVNGGNSWQQVFSNTRIAFTDIEFVSQNEGYLCTSNQIYKTIDAGTTWTKVVALGNTNFIELHFTDSTHGWACCFNGTILKFN